MVSGTISIKYIHNRFELLCTAELLLPSTLSSLNGDLPLHKPFNLLRVLLINGINKISLKVTLNARGKELRLTQFD